MPKPLIGITTDYTDIQDNDKRCSASTYHLKEDYTLAVEAGGGIPVLLPTIEAIPSLLDRIDALVVSGGNFDIDPQLYRETRRQTTRLVNPRRTNFELALINGALERDLPLLGICGGEQALNIARGGTLIQDIPAEMGRCHEQPTPNTETSHKVHIDPHSRLYDILGETVVDVNSTHHQAIKKAGPSLHTSAFSEDGVIEGIEIKNRRFCIGVQWHPEALLKNNRHWLKLFTALAHAAG